MKKDQFILLLSLFFFPSVIAPKVYGETEMPVEEKPAFELPEVEIIGEDQSRLAITGEWKPLADQPFLKKVGVGVPEFSKISPALFPSPVREQSVSEVKFAYGNFDTLMGSITHGRQVKEKIHYLFSIGKYKTEGEFPRRRYNLDNVFLEFGFNPIRKLELEFSASGLFKDYQISNSIDTWKAEKINFTLGLEKRIGESASITCQSFVERTRLRKREEASSELIGGKLQARAEVFSGSILNICGDVYRELVTLKERERYLVSFFSLIDEFLLFQKLGVAIGGEYKERSKPSVSFAYPVARISYELTPHLNIWIKYEPELQVLTFSQRYVDKDYIDPSARLLPQKRALSLQEGIDYQVVPNLSGRLSFFQSKFKNFVALYDNGRIGNLRNIPRVYAQGVETSLSYAWQENFLQEVKYIYAEVENEDKPEKKIPYMPCHSLKISLNYGYGFLKLNLFLIAESKRAYDDIRTLAPYWAVGGEVSYAVTRGVSFFVTGENLFEQKYSQRYGYPLDHIKFGGGLRAKW